MKRVLKWVGLVLLAVVIFISGWTYFSSRARLNRVYQIPKETVAVPNDEESIARGRHIFQYRGCEACHSAKGYLNLSLTDEQFSAHLNLPSQDVPRMEGNVYMDDPAVGKVNATNLTSGKGGVGSAYKDGDWVRSIRHGVRPDGTPLLFMPSTEFYFMSDEDLGDVIAYIKSAPPVDNELPKSSLSWTGRLLMTFVPGLTFIPAEVIPHDAARPVAPKVGMTPEYGEYLTHSCKVCHGPTMSGGKIPVFPSSWPAAPNLTWGSGSALPNWTEQDFITAMRMGKRPQGALDINSAYMPWTSFRHMTDDELRAVWVYLQALPPKDLGNR
jgi:mono/diheme cytochrome c family protein